jgi:hypothetical protein
MRTVSHRSTSHCYFTAATTTRFFVVWRLSHLHACAVLSQSAQTARMCDLWPDFRAKLAKGMDEDKRHVRERRVAVYSNSLVRRK